MPTEANNREFFKCVEVGKIGEKMLLDKFPELSDNTKDNVRLPDIKCPNGNFIEVKFDSSVKCKRDWNGKQINILCERFKNIETKTFFRVVSRVTGMVPLRLSSRWQSPKTN